MPKFGRQQVDFERRLHGGAPGFSLHYHWKPSQPSNPESRVSPEYGFIRRPIIGVDSRRAMLGGPPKHRLRARPATRARTDYATLIARGTASMQADDFRAGGPAHLRYGCRGRSCELITQASTAKPSVPTALRGKVFPVGAKNLKMVSKRATGRFGPGRPMNPADPFTGGQGLGALPVRFRRRGVRSPKLQAFFQRIRDWWDRARAQGRIRGRRGARFAARGFGTVDDLEEGI